MLPSNCYYFHCYLQWGHKQGAEDQAGAFSFHCCCLRTQPSTPSALPGWLEAPDAFPVRTFCFLECDWSYRKKKKRRKRLLNNSVCGVGSIYISGRNWCMVLLGECWSNPRDHYWLLVRHRTVPVDLNRQGWFSCFNFFGWKKTSGKKFFNLLYCVTQKSSLVLLPHFPVRKSNLLSPGSITESYLKVMTDYIYTYIYVRVHIYKYICLKAFHHLKPSWIHAEQFWILA